MLYEIGFYEVTTEQGGHDCPKAQTFVVEAPPYQVRGSVIFNSGLDKFVEEHAHAASVMWGFVPVDVEVAEFFPTRVGFARDNRFSVRSIIFEKRIHVTKEVSR